MDLRLTRHTAKSEISKSNKIAMKYPNITELSYKDLVCISHYGISCLTCIHMTWM